MKNVIKLEELAQFALSIFLYSALDFAWWWYLILLLTPDFGALGYLINTKVGAFTYNLTHHKGLAILLYLLGVYSANPVVQFAGLLLLGHSSLDRTFGYGLKYPDSFQNTHLGKIGKAAQPSN
jgi:hypothetical protein